MARSSKKGPRSRRNALKALSSIELGTLSNGALLLVPGVDGRSRVARRARRIAQSLFDQLGGAKGMPEWRKQLVQRVAFACISCEVIETKMLQGEEVDQELHRKCVLTMSIMLQRLGLDPTSVPTKDDTPKTEEIQVIRRIIVDAPQPSAASNTSR